MKFRYKIIDNSFRRLMYFCIKCWDATPKILYEAASKGMYCEKCIEKLESEEPDFAIGIEGCNAEEGT